MANIPKALNLSPYTSDEDVVLVGDAYNMIYLTGSSALDVRMPPMAITLGGWLLYVTNTSTAAATIYSAMADGDAILATIDPNITTMFVLNKTAGDDDNTWVVITFAASGGGEGAGSVNDLRIAGNDNNTAGVDADYCIALGATAYASETGSIAIGSASIGGENSGAYAGGEGAIAIGSATVEGGNGAYALGLGSIAIGSAVDGADSSPQAAAYAIAIGCNDTGSNTGALNEESIAIGYNATVSADRSMYVGSGGENTSPDSIVIGNYSNVTNGSNVICIGNNNTMQSSTNQIMIGNSSTSAAADTITLSCRIHENSVAGQFRVVTDNEVFRSSGAAIGGIAWPSVLGITTTPTAGEYRGGLIMITSTSTINIPTGTDMDAAIDSPYQNMTFNCILFPSTNLVAITVAGNAGMTLYGPAASGAGVPVLLTFFRNETAAWMVIAK
jgi:hypothetical protein